MSLSDRVLRSLFVALGVGLGWGIRGDFGGPMGAMAPGATLGMAFAYVTGQRSMFKWMPLLAAGGAFFISLGGMMSYGVLHGYAKSDTLVNYSYGFLTLLLQGGAWGGFGGAALGMLLERDRVKPGEWFGCLVTAYASGWLFYVAVVDVLGFHVNPPRGNTSIAFTGAMIGVFGYLAYNRKWYGLRGAMFGYIGFGLGMSLGRLVANATYVQPGIINHWNVMEVLCGFIGGFIFTFGMLGRRFPDPPWEEGWKWVGGFGVFYVLTFIPYRHRFHILDAERRLEEWRQSAATYGIDDPDGFGHMVLALLTLVPVASLVASLVWLYWWRTDKYRTAALPVLAFSLLMLLYQNLHALYFWYPTREGYINMHSVFWVLFGLMVLFVLAFEFVWPWRREATLPEEAFDRVPWRLWVAATVGTYLLIVVLAGWTNGEETMKSANMRFPIWSWRDGSDPPEPYWPFLPRRAR